MNLWEQSPAPVKKVSRHIFRLTAIDPDFADPTQGDLKSPIYLFIYSEEGSGKVDEKISCCLESIPRLFLNYHLANSREVTSRDAVVVDSTCHFLT